VRSAVLPGLDTLKWHLQRLQKQFDASPDALAEVADAIDNIQEAFDALDRRIDAIDQRLRDEEERY